MFWRICGYYCVGLVAEILYFWSINCNYQKDTKQMKTLYSIIFTIMFIAVSSFTYANKTAVKIIVPAKVAKGSQITITINVMHKGNTAGHYTDWVYLKINGKEVKRWLYDKTNLPADANFTLYYTYTVTDKTINLEAMGDCSIHGSAGVNKASINAE